MTTLRERLSQARLPLSPGTLPGVAAAAVTLAACEFVRSGLYGAYLQVAAPQLLNLSRADGVAVAASAFVAHFFSDTVMRSPAGALINRYGVRPVMLGGAAICLLAMVLLSGVSSVWMLLFVAALHGVGFSAMWPGTMNLTADSAHDSHQGRALTLITMGVMPLSGAGFLVQGALGSSQPFGVVAALLIGLQALALVAALGLPARRVRPVVAAPVQARARVALRALAPLIPAAFLQTLTLSLLGPLLFTLYPELGLNYWGLVSVLVLGGAVAYAAMPFTGRFADGGRARLSVTLGFGLLTVGLGLFALQPPVWALYPAAAILGVGYAFVVPGWAALVVSRLPEADRPAAWGVLMTVENVGTWVGPLLGALAYRLIGAPGPFLTGGVLALLATVGYVLFRHSFDTRRAAAPQP